DREGEGGAQQGVLQQDDLFPQLHARLLERRKDGERHAGLTISVGKTEISVIFPVFATHRDRNFGSENCIFEFQIQKYKSQILVKQTKFRTVKTKLLTLGGATCEKGDDGARGWPHAGRP